MPVNIQFIQSPMAPAVAGPYSQAIRFDNLIFFSGQIGLNPQTGMLISEDFAAQAEQVFKNLAAVIASSGCKMQDVLRVDVFLTDMNDFAKLNEIYSRWFGYHKPTRQTVQVSALPKNAKIEVSFIAGIG